MTETYEWSPLTEAETDQMTGMDVLRREAETSPIAALAVRRIEAATEAMQPALARLRNEWERQLMEGTGAAPDGLAQLITD